MKISYAITVCNEHKEIKKLLTFLFDHKRKEDQVVVQMDTKATKEVWQACESFEVRPFDEYRLVECALEKNFAAYKNNLNKNCDGDWIFHIDAEEIPNEYLIEALPFILEANSDVEAYWIPRVNTVAGITDNHIAKWGWRVNEDGWVNFPDWQMRLYRNVEDIYWIKPVHEQLKGYTKFANLPAEERYCLYHPKILEDKKNKMNFTIQYEIWTIYR